MILADSVLSGDRLSLTRLLSQVENETPEGIAALEVLFPHTGRAHLIGVTGAPGSGKSSLVNQLVLQYRRTTEMRVAVIAVDPTSPFTGGAILGDRVRMRDLAGDPKVFIRSMASRGSLSGVAHATAFMAQVLDAADFDIIIIETVGAGQAEVDIARLAHTTLVVETPGMGDDIQAIKAGILEIADILVINKADQAGVEHTESALRSMLELAHPVEHVFQHHEQSMKIGVHTPTEGDHVWVPPIVRTVALDGTGIPELIKAVSCHLEHLRTSGDWVHRERVRLESELSSLIQETLQRKFRASISMERYEDLVTKVLERKVSPWQAMKILLNGDGT